MYTCIAYIYIFSLIESVTIEHRKIKEIPFFVFWSRFDFLITFYEMVIRMGNCLVLSFDSEHLVDIKVRSYEYLIGLAF